MSASVNIAGYPSQYSARFGSGPAFQKWTTGASHDRLYLARGPGHSVRGMSYPSPRYFAEQGEVSATFRTSDAEPELNIGVASRVSLLSTGEATGGLYGLYRWDLL